VWSVARSPLKQSEDYLVGQSIVFSTEALLRSRGEILQGREACVIGFGKVGNSIACMLRDRNIRVTVYDTDPVRMTQALAQGFRTARSRHDAVSQAGLIVCATGNLALRCEDFSCLPNGAHVVSVTSSDDELELTPLKHLYHSSTLDEHIACYSNGDHYFYLLNHGNAVNFIHRAVVGPFIFLVQAEILAAVSALSEGRGACGFAELGLAERRCIAATWLRHFNV
jgi:adenosylhomocysteinase